MQLVVILLIAPISALIEDIGLFNVVSTLDKTAFFPEGGGQYADKGILADANVLDVQINDNVIYHLTD